MHAGTVTINIDQNPQEIDGNRHTKLCQKLLPALQQYEWGVIGSASLAGRVWLRSHNGTSSRSLDENAPHAEAWFGCHPRGTCWLTDPLGTQGSSVAPNPRQSLQTFFSASSNELGFLLKILSTRKPLSIQSHPDRLLAEQLHGCSPGSFPDPNDKPEISIALESGTRALCGFRDPTSFIAALAELPELEQIWPGLGDLQSASDSELLRSAFAALMQAPKHLLRRCRAALLRRPIEQDMNKLQSVTADDIVAPKASNLQPSEMFQEALSRGCFSKHTARLSTQTNEMLKSFVEVDKSFPDDRGCFLVFLLNIINYNEGECIFIAPNVPHAYLRGQMIECMTNSDNVIRAALTSKPIDLDLFTETILYKPYKGFRINPRRTIIDSLESGHTTSPQILTSSNLAGSSVVWRYVVSEVSSFQVCLITLPLPPPRSTLWFSPPGSSGPAILLTLQGTSWVELKGRPSCDEFEDECAVEFLQPGVPVALQAGVQLRFISDPSIRHTIGNKKCHFSNAQNRCIETTGDERNLASVDSPDPIGPGPLLNFANLLVGKLDVPFVAVLATDHTSCETQGTCCKLSEVGTCN